MAGGDVRGITLEDKEVSNVFGLGILVDTVGRGSGQSSQPRARPCGTNPQLPLLISLLLWRAVAIALVGVSTVNFPNHLFIA